MTNYDFAPQSEDGIKKIATINQIFKDISLPESCRLVTEERLDLLKPLFVEILSSAGVNFEKAKEPDIQKLLRERKLRFGGDKWQALVSVVDKNFFDSFQSWATAESSNLPKLEDGDDSSRSRGLMQIFANTVAFSSGAISAGDYLQDIKWRVGAFYERPLNKKIKNTTEEPLRSELKIKLADIRAAYSIPTPGDTKEREKYVGYSRVNPGSLEKFLKKIA